MLRLCLQAGFEQARIVNLYRHYVQADSYSLVYEALGENLWKVPLAVQPL